MGRELKDTQLSVEFAAGLAYASAFARLAGRKPGAVARALVSTQRLIRNDEAQSGLDDGVVVPGFTSAELDDPWAALRAREQGELLGGVEEGEGEGGQQRDPRRLFPELQACDQVGGGPGWVWSGMMAT